MHQYLAFHENVGQAGRQWTVLAPNQEPIIQVMNQRKPNHTKNI